jgi:hypothetical protein
MIQAHHAEPDPVARILIHDVSSSLDQGDSRP